MALLSDQRRAAATQELMEQLSALREPLDLIKADLRPVIDALDDYMNTNAQAINAALPQPARGVMTQDQKARALTLVVAYRYLDKV